MSYAEKSVSKIRALDPEENPGAEPEPTVAPAPIVPARPDSVEAEHWRLLQKTPAILHATDLEDRLVFLPRGEWTGF